MNTLELEPTPAAPATAESQPHDKQTRPDVIYVLLMTAMTLVWLLLPFVAARSRLLDQMSNHMFWHIMDYHAAMRGTHCDVVVFGDSTGATGIDPLAVQSLTGYKTCVLSLPYMALASTGNRVLDDYLSGTAAPKLIIFADHAAHLRPPAYDEDWGIIDGWLLVDRLASPRQAALFYLAQPKDSLIFAEHWWQQIFTLNPALQFDPFRRSYERDAALLQKHNGYFPLTSSEDHDKICATQDSTPSFDREYLDSLRRRYSVRGTRVLIYASPVRSCDHNVAAYKNVARSIGIAPPLVLPVKDFSDAWHLNVGGAQTNSTIVSRLIVSALGPASSNQAGGQN